MNRSLVSQLPFEDAFHLVRSSRLLSVCPNLAARTIRKGRNDPRNDPRNDASRELQEQTHRWYHLFIHLPLLHSSARGSSCGAALVQRGTPGYGDWFIAELWRRAPTASAGPTQEELADQAGLSVRGLSDLERVPASSLAEYHYSHGFADS